MICFAPFSTPLFFFHPASLRCESSSEIKPLRVFKDRPPRFDLNVPLTFRTENGSKTGHCVNVSASGMLIAFDRPVELFTIGEIALLAGEFYINIKARVARTHGTDAGLAFLINTDNDRAVSRILVEFAAVRMQPPEDGKIGCA